jgi:hypothetical protein
MCSVGKGCVFASAINENALQIVILQYAVARSVGTADYNCHTLKAQYFT